MNKNLSTENIEEKQLSQEITGCVEKKESINPTDAIAGEEKQISNDAKNCKSSSKQTDQVKLPVNVLEKEKTKKTSNSKKISTPNLKLLEDETKDIEGKYAFIEFL